MSTLGAWLFAIAIVLLVALVGLLITLAFVPTSTRRRLWRRVIRPTVWLWVTTALAWLALSPVWSAGGAAEAEPEFDLSSITAYEGDFTVAKNGDLTVVERIAVYYPLPRHGIFRFFDVVDPSAPTARRIPEDISVERDGKPEPWSKSTRDDGRFRVIRIGDAAVEIEGDHEYTLRYRIDGVIEPGTTGQRSQFYWNLIPGGWTMTIDRSELKVHLPVESSTTVQCAVGVRRTDGCEVDGEGTRSLTVRTGHLAERTPVTVKTGLDMPTPPAGNARLWSQPWDGVLGSWSASNAPIAVGAVVLLVGFAALAGRRTRRRVVEKEPPFPVMYAPPEGIGPAQASYLVSESVGRPQYIATLLYLASKNVIALEFNEDKTWSIGSGPQPSSSVDEVSRAAMSDLKLHAGKPVRLGTSKVSTGKQIQASERSLLAAPRKVALQRAWMTEVHGAGRAGALAILSLVVAFAVAMFGFGMSALCLIPFAYAVPALGVIHTGASTRRTETGRRLWSEAGGFKRMLSTPSSEERFDFSARKDLYTAYIPWAVAFGVADAWAEKYRFETGETPPMPTYIGGTSGQAQEWMDHNATGSIGSAVEASFAAAVGSSIGAYMASIAPPQSSSSSSGSSWSSSSSGGGFSGGGGGGGGGGGSW